MKPEVMILVAKGDPEQKPRLYACPKCGQYNSPKIYACREEQAHEAAYQAAANCYNCREHNNCSECGIECDRHRIKCDACHKASVFAKAEKIDAAGVEHCFGWDGTFYHDVSEAEDAGAPLFEAPLGELCLAAAIAACAATLFALVGAILIAIIAALAVG